MRTHSGDRDLGHSDGLPVKILSMVRIVACSWGGIDEQSRRRRGFSWVEVPTFCSEQGSDVT